MLTLIEAAIKAMCKAHICGLRKDCLALALKAHNYERMLDEQVEATAERFFEFATRGVR